MQKAVPVGVGAMAALIGVEFAQPQADRGGSRERGVCAAANDNGGGQVVLSGDKAAVERAVEIAKAQGRAARDDAAGIRSLPLSADAPGGGCHGGSAGEGRRSSRRAFRSSPMCGRAPISDPADIVRSLVDQVTGTVRWRESVLSWRNAASTVLRSRRRQGAGRS